MTIIAVSNHLLKSAEHARAVWSISIPNDHGKQHILNPDYWAHCALQFRRGDFIEIIRDDLTAYFKCIIIDSGRIYAKLKLIEEKDLSSEVKEAISLRSGELDKFEIKWINIGSKYGVFRKSDGQVIEQGLATKEDAEEYLAKNIKSLTA
jgi:hypothetical protein